MRKTEEIASSFAPQSALNGRDTFFLVGIGGAGMSALARMLKHRGFSVEGTDSTQSPETDRLLAEGFRVTIGHSGDPVSRLRAPTAAIILTDAIDLSHSAEVAAATALGIPMVRRSQALGWLLRDKKVIAVTGTHGKTTTTGMLGSALVEAGLDPLVVVGANIPQFGGPVREGNGEWAVVEACEAYDSFHDLQPHDVVLTNLELDHIDFHGSYERLLNSVVRFVDRVPTDGSLIFCAEDDGAAEVAGLFKGNKVGYSLNGARVDLSVPGRHNQLNMTGVMAAAKTAGADEVLALEGAKRFQGAERRLQKLFDSSIVVIDDYAHHPTEISASLQAVREAYFPRPQGRLIVVYQPHLYSRTAPLVAEFAESLDSADLVVLTDIYPAREDPIPGVSSSRIAEKVTKPVLYVPSRFLLPMEVAKIAEPGDVIVGMGAGNIQEFAPALIKELHRPLAPLGNPDTKSGLRIAVVYGGDSAEREVSLLSGRAIATALKSLGHIPKLVDVTELLLKTGSVDLFIGPDRPDMAFLAVHGTHAEDGAIQGLLELLHVPYTGSGIQASAIAMDKAMTKTVLAAHGIQTPTGVHLTDRQQHVPIAPPLIVKPNAQGSTVGLSFVESHGELENALDRAFAYDTEVLVEEWIRGMEISVPVLDGEALLPVEIAPTSGFYDFESKYTPGATEEIVPARLPEPLLRKAQEISLRVHEAMGCFGATRTDMIVRGEELFVLEINTLPGMTGTSLLPNSAKGMGIAFPQLCQRLVDDCLTRAHVMGGS